MKNVGYYNGNTSLLEDLTVSAGDRAVYFGDGVYDAAFGYNRKIFAISDHLDRFYRSMELLRINPPCKRDELEALLNRLASQIDTEESILVYWQASRGTMERSHAFPPDDIPANLLIMVKEYERKDVNKPFKLISLEDQRFYYCHIKTLNLIPNVLASQQAKEAGCDEAIFHRNGRVTECSHSNISIIKNSVFQTAPLDNLILPGTARKHLIEICGELQIPVVEKPYSLDELLKADEIIVSSSGSLCIPVSVVDGLPVGRKNPALVQAMYQRYIAKINKELGTALT